ncbi:hypothetical protein DVR12_17595 [Chitinophaga silvatica]|uniref:Uncharacterized protein n=1 Tax=Chitinophaga silvatica TaxID=2282649 RepID=A0A3E1Y7V5_9BACT|nr:hypothetical protein DVR12_17595 [Chitinophaga silvatica]
MVKYLCLLGFLAICGKTINISDSTKVSYKIITDTGFVIYTQPHFTGLFVVTRSDNFIKELDDSNSLKYYKTYHEDFKKFILLNDTLPKFIKYDSSICVYNNGKLDQVSITYFRVVLTLRIPKNVVLNNVVPRNYQSEYYLENKRSGKKTYLMEYGSPIWDIFDCIAYKLLP